MRAEFGFFTLRPRRRECRGEDEDEEEEEGEEEEEDEWSTRLKVNFVRSVVSQSLLRTRARTQRSGTRTRRLCHATADSWRLWSSTSTSTSTRIQNRFAARTMALTPKPSAASDLQGARQIRSRTAGSGRRTIPSLS